MQATRIYQVHDGESVRLIDAASAAAAIRHAAIGKYKASPASAREVANIMATGVKVETAAALKVAGEAK